jgi:mannosyltransferase
MIDPSNTQDRKPGWWSVLFMIVLAAGIALRWVQLGRSSLWFDEGYTAWLVSLPTPEIVRVLHVDTAPPLYYLLLRAWTLLFGRSEFALRSLSASIASGSLLLFYPLAMRVLRDRGAALVALMIFAASVMQVAYAHEARFYALMTLLAEVDLLLVLWAIERPTSWQYPAIILAWGLSLYANNTMSIYLVGLAGLWLVFPRAQSFRRRVLDIAITSLGAAVLYLPWIPTILAQSRLLKGNFWIDRPTGETFIRTIAMLAGVNDRGVGGWEWQRIAVAFFGFLVFVAVGFCSRQTIRKAAGLTLFGLLPVAVIFIYSQFRQPLFVDRALIPTTLAAPLLIALPLTWNVIRRMSVGVGVLVLIPCILSLRGNYLGEHPEDWREVCKYVQSSSARDRLVVFAANEGELLYDYYSHRGDYTSSPNITGVPADFFADDPPRTMRRVRSSNDLQSLQSQLSQHSFDEVILVESHYWWSDEHRLTLALLGQSYVPTEQAEFDGIIVHRFRPNARLAQ